MIEPKSLGERCVDLAMVEMENGVRSDNAYRKGPNISERISEYFQNCVRDLDGDGDFELLGIESGNWCAAGVSWCLNRALVDMSQRDFEALGLLGDPTPLPHYYRAGVVELVADAKERGIWVPVSEWDNETVQRGDLAIWDRTRPGGPAWHRHVNRVLGCEVGERWKGYRHLKTIGGNENGRQWNISERGDADLVKLLGFIQYPRVPVAKPTFSAEERADLRAQIDQCHAVIAVDWREA